MLQRDRETERRRDRETEETEETDAIRAAGSSLEEIDLDALSEETKQQIRNTIQRNLPQQSGVRNNKSGFFLAKSIRGMPELANAHRACLHPIIEHFAMLAEPRTSGTHTVDDYISEFNYAWDRIKFPGDFSMHLLAEEVHAKTPHPACIEMQYENPQRILLVGLCAELQRRQGVEPFWLACRTAEDVLKLLGYETSYQTCARMLHGLRTDGILNVARSGTQTHATRYRFVWKPGTRRPKSEIPDWLKAGSNGRTRRADT